MTCAPQTLCSAPREQDERYPFVVAQLAPRERTIESACDTHWIVQRFIGGRWRSKWFCRTKDGLTRTGQQGVLTPPEDNPEAWATLYALPNRYAEGRREAPQSEDDLRTVTLPKSGVTPPANQEFMKINV